MRSLLLLAAFLVACAGGAAPPSLDRPPPAPAPWSDRQLGTAGDDQALGLVGDAEGLYVVGYEGGQRGIDNLEPGGDPVGVITRLDPSGETVWRRTLDAQVVDAAAARPGGLTFVGRRRVYPPALRPHYDLVLGDVGTDGTVGPLVQDGGPRSERPLRLALAPGGLVAAGYDDAYVPTNYVESWEDPFVYVRDAAGARFFRFDTPPADVLGGLAVHPDGTIDVVGTGWIGGRHGAYLVRQDASGARVAERLLSAGTFEWAAAVHRLPDGDLLVAGSTHRPLGATPRGDQDAFLMRLDGATLSPRWIAQEGTPGADYVVDMTVDEAGNAYLLGETTDAFPGRVNEGTYDLFVIAFTAAGETAWTWQRGSAGDELAGRITLGPGGRVYVSGATNGALAGPSQGGFDAVILEADPSR